MNAETTRFDAIIIGSGAGGSAAAYRLAREGWHVLLLEKGEALPADGSTLNIDKVFRRSLFKSHEPWMDRRGCLFMPEECFNLGGKTKWYGAALLRFAPHEFEADPGHRCSAWPISYQALSPYYDEAEQLLGVREFEPERDLRAIFDRVTYNGAGWKAHPLPLALAPDILAHPEEARCFDAFASVKGLKFDAQTAFLQKVAALPNLRVLTGHAVARLVAARDRPVRISGVLIQDGRRFEADRVLLAAGALHSPRLLQRYLETTGLAQHLPSARLVGCHYKHHLLTAVLGFSRLPKTDVLRKTMLLLNERFPHSSVQPLGFDAATIGALMPRFVPGALGGLWGQRAYGFFLQTEDGSDERNRVVAQADGSLFPQLDYDPARLPAAVMEHRGLVRAFRRALLGAGLMGVAKPIPLAGTAHACGTLITGNDPRASVVDAQGKVHGLENLYVIDGSVLPRSSRVNPSLTIYAWALRSAQLLAHGGRCAERGRRMSVTSR